MQLEFTKLITQASSHSDTHKPVETANKKPTVTRQQRKHIAEQFEFPFVRQIAVQGSDLSGSAKLASAA